MSPARDKDATAYEPRPEFLYGQPPEPGAVLTDRQLEALHRTGFEAQYVDRPFEPDHWEPAGITPVWLRDWSPPRGWIALAAVLIAAGALALAWWL